MRGFPVAISKQPNRADYASRYQFVVSLINSKNVSAAELKKLEKIIADARRRKQRQQGKGE